MRARRLATLLFAIAVLVSGAWLALPYARGLSFVIRAAEIAGTARRLADLDTTATREREIAIPTRRGPLRARLYEPSRPRHRAALLVSGLHPAGIDEPRLVGLARHLSASGLTIVTPDIPELSRFEITPATTDAIEQAGLWLSSDAELAPDRKVALMGISFSGGLSAVAAGRRSPTVWRSSSRSAGTPICRACCGICARASSRGPGIRSVSQPSRLALRLGLAVAPLRTVGAEAGRRTPPTRVAAAQPRAAGVSGRRTSRLSVHRTTRASR